ncbi:MAG: bifunctional riboflavin kinase/FAD synthetase [Acidobacteriota bacterium]
MQIIDNLADLPEPLTYPVLTIGVFDGVHRGHQTVLKRVVEQARSLGGTSILLTFSPHPQRVISPGDSPLLLQTSRQKLQVLGHLGLDVTVMYPFTRDLSLLTPEQFARDILYNHGIREIHVGGNFRFGHRRSGDFQTLKTLGERFGFAVYAVDPIHFRGQRISSTRIRNLLQEGRAPLAARLLGRPYRIAGTVVRGAGLGVKLGFPTANLNPENELVPATGIYVTRTVINEKFYRSVTSVGYRPTVEEKKIETPVVETYLLDFDGDLYGRTIALDFCFRLREEKKFDSLDVLKEHIAKDVARTRRYLERTKCQ